LPLGFQFVRGVSAMLAILFLGISAVAAQAPETGPPTSYIFHDTPPTLLFMWGAGSFCAVLTLVASFYNIRLHMAAANAQGFGQEELITSFGVRADRIMQLLLVPAVCSITGVVEMFIPGSSDLMSFIRTIQLAFAMVRLIELLFILNGTQQHIVSKLPQEPRSIFASPPLCCLRCSVVPQLSHLRLFVAGVQQFMILLPMMGVLDVYLGHRFADDSLPKKFSSIVVTLSTMLGMWAFKCLLPLLTESVEGLDQRTVGSMEHFLMFQMMAAKLLEKVLPLVVPGNFTGKSWVMPHDVFIVILTGFILCVLQLSLATLGLQAYVADESMYPKVNFDSDLPPDTLAALDMSGVDPHKWRLLEDWAKKSTTRESAASSGPLLLGHKGPNYMRVEAQKPTEVAEAEASAPAHQAEAEV